jgi:hypothetical protein
VINLLKVFIVSVFLFGITSSYAFDSFYGIEGGPGMGAYAEEKFTALLFPAAKDVVSAGIMSLSFQPYSGRVFWKMKTKNLVEVMAAHIHCKGSGDIGASLIPLGIVPDPTWKFQVGVILVPDQDNACNWSSLHHIIAAMRSGQAYVNVHTKAHPGGEITGDILDIGF